MDFLKKFEPTPANVIKAVGLLFLAVFVISIVLSLMGSSLGSLNSIVRKTGGISMPQIGPSMMMDDGYYGEVDYATEESARGIGGGSTIKLSLDNIGVPPMPPIGGGAGNDAEDYEVTDYNASIETRDKSMTCSLIAELKSREYIVFENANEYDHGCRYAFKVETDRAPEVLSFIETLNPRDLSKNTYTIKRQLDDFTSETEILKNKLATIDETLKTSISAYDNITELAVRTQDAEALAKIIDSKLGMLERLTQEGININAQLERLERAKADQLDRLVYTFFYINVFENKYVDGKVLQDSWKSAVKQAVYDVNSTVQDITVNLIAFLFVIIQFVLYIFIIIFVARFMWGGAKKIWNK